MVLLGNSLPEHRKVEPSEAGIKIKTEFISGILISYDLMIPFRIHGSTKNAITVQIFIDQITYCHVWTIRCRMSFKILLSAVDRSEEHTSELQSRGHLVCRLLLEKKKENV